MKHKKVPKHLKERIPYEGSLASPRLELIPSLEVPEQPFPTYLDVLGAEDPEAAFDLIADNKELVHRMLIGAELDVAEDAVELELYIRSKEEKQQFSKTLKDFISFLDLVVTHDFESMRDTHTEGELKHYVIEKILGSCEAILTLENDMRLNASWYERLLGRLGRTPLRRTSLYYALIAGGAAGAVESNKLLLEALPEEKKHYAGYANAAIVGGIAIRSIMKRFFDKTPDKLIEPVEGYTPMGESKRSGRKLYAEHKEHTDKAKARLYELAGKKYLGKEAYSDAMIDELLSALHDTLIEAYDVDNEDNPRKKAAATAIKAVGVGIVSSSLGVNEKVADKTIMLTPKKKSQKPKGVHRMDAKAS